LVELEKGQCDTSFNDKGSKNMKKYRHLTFEDRIYIEVWRWEYKSVKYISE